MHRRCLPRDIERYSLILDYPTKDTLQRKHVLNAHANTLLLSAYHLNNQFTFQHVYAFETYTVVLKYF